MEKIKNIALVLFWALFIVSLCFNVHHCSSMKHGEVYQDTVRTTYVDTIPYYKPVLKDSVVIRYVTQRLPVVYDKEENFTNKGNNVPEIIPQSGNNTFENNPDSADVIIPITQKVYEDSVYKAYVSGYNPHLDSLILLNSHDVISVKEYHKSRRWGIGVQVGYGMTITPSPQFAPYIGVGVYYKIF